MLQNIPCCTYAIIYETILLLLNIQDSFFSLPSFSFPLPSFSFPLFSSFVSKSNMITNFLVCKSFHIDAFLSKEKVSQRGSAESKGTCGFKFNRDFQIASQKRCNNLYFIQQNTRVPICPSPWSVLSVTAF